MFYFRLGTKFQKLLFCGFPNNMAGYPANGFYIIFGYPVSDTRYI